MTIKLNAATGGGSVSLSAPNSTTSNLDVELTLPVDDGAANTFLKSDGSGTLSWASASSDSITEGNTTVECVDTGSNGHITFDTEGSEAMRINSSQNVGIGTTNPTEPLTLGFADLGSARIGFRSATYSQVAMIEGSHDSGAAEGSLRFYTRTGGTERERMRITNQGFLKASPRVTDGTHGAQRMSSPVHEFTCDDNDWVMQMTHTSGSGAEVSGLYIKYSQVSPNNTSQDFLYCADSTALRFSVRSNGGIRNYQSNDVNLCDEREKKNIVNLDSTWDCLKQWELKKFHYNEDADDSDLRYGVIAQQVAPHCPEVISEWVKQGAEDAVLDEDGNVVTPAKEEIVRMGVKEQQMYWMAIRALQEAQTRIETLETANASLEARLTALEGGAS